MAEKRDNLLREFRKKRVEVGDSVVVEEGLLYEYCKDPHRDVTVKVKKVLEDGSIIVCNSENYRDEVTLTDGDYELDIFNVGADPFLKSHGEATSEQLTMTCHAFLENSVSMYGARVLN